MRIWKGSHDRTRLWNGGHFVESLWAGSHFEKSLWSSSHFVNSLWASSHFMKRLLTGSHDVKRYVPPQNPQWIQSRLVKVQSPKTDKTILEDRHGWVQTSEVHLVHGKISQSEHSPGDQKDKQCLSSLGCGPSGSALPDGGELSLMLGPC